MSFRVEGPEDAQITVELEAEAQYEVYLDGASTGKMETNLWRKAFFQRRAWKWLSCCVKICKMAKKTKKVVYFLPGSAVTNPRNGWDSALAVRPGILLRKNLYPQGKRHQEAVSPFPGSSLNR